MEVVHRAPADRGGVERPALRLAGLQARAAPTRSCSREDLATVGIGAGQMSRVDSVRLAVEKSRRGLAEGRGAGLRRLLPVRRRPRARHRGGRRRAIIQPGGSRDDEVVAAADAAGIAMVFTRRATSVTERTSGVECLGLQPRVAPAIRPVAAAAIVHARSCAVGDALVADDRARRRPCWPCSAGSSGRAGSEDAGALDASLGIATGDGPSGMSSACSIGPRRSPATRQSTRRGPPNAGLPPATRAAPDAGPSAGRPRPPRPLCRDDAAGWQERPARSSGAGPGEAAGRAARAGARSARAGASPVASSARRRR